MTRLPDEPVSLPPSAVGAIRELVEWFRRELSASRERAEILAQGKHTAEKRAHDQEQRAERAERRLADRDAGVSSEAGVVSEPSGHDPAERDGEE